MHHASHLLRSQQNSRRKYEIAFPFLGPASMLDLVPVKKNQEMNGMRNIEYSAGNYE